MKLLNSLKNKNFIFLAIILAFFVFSQPVLAGTAMQNALDNMKTTADTGYVEGYDTNIPATIGKVVGAALAFVGVLFLILIIYGGFIWMTARGNEQEVTKAKDLITAAVIGLVIILAAYAITSYIGNIITTA
jgi:uncharacterized BrkB/YihY/UPF0761 family membrane protein